MDPSLAKKEMKLMNRSQPCLAIYNLLLALMLLPVQAHAEQSVEAWMRLYSGGGSGAQAVAVDGNGNVYVTGSAIGSGGVSEYATLAYSSAGVPLWTNRYRGPGNDHHAQALAVDGNGRVYVTGSSRGSGGYYDYATVAYSSAGVALWTNRYGGPAMFDDYPQAIATDGNGNVYVAGYSRGSGTGWDYATVAYSSGGVPLWTNLYDGAANSDDQALAMAVDGSGNVYVTGRSGYPTYDYATLAYSSSGVPLWTNRYNGPGNDDDEAIDVAVDGQGIVYVTGSAVRAIIYPYSYRDWTTIAYSSAGVPLWTTRYDEGFDNVYGVQGVAAGGSNVVVAGTWRDGGGNYQYATLAYSSGGVALWTNYYRGPGGTDYAQGVAVDNSGNAYVTGYSASTNAYPYNYAYATVKYSSQGLPLWTNRHRNGMPQGKHSLAIGPDGALYVTGISDADFTTVKYISVPTLSITLTSTNTALVSWPSPSTGFDLQQNTSLNTPNWVPPPETVSSNDTLKFIIANPSTGTRFFRLVHP
jgi:hypothetical protein